MNNIHFWLGRMYAADVMGKGKYHEMKKVIKNRLAKGSPLESEARKRLAEVSALPRVMGVSRCFVSDKHLKYLTELLN
jgi:hypothetical protein